MADSFVSQWHQLISSTENYLSYYTPSPSPSPNFNPSPDLSIPPLFHLNNFYAQADSLSSTYKNSIQNSSADYQNSQTQDVGHLGRLLGEENMIWKLLVGGQEVGKNSG